MASKCCCVSLYVIYNPPTVQQTREDKNSKPSVRKGKGKGKVHPCTGTEALYRPYGP